jgi:hypothetical protein
VRRIPANAEIVGKFIEIYAHKRLLFFFERRFFSSVAIDIYSRNFCAMEIKVPGHCAALGLKGPAKLSLFLLFFS